MCIRDRDQTLLEKAMMYSGCIPSYWNSFANLNLRDCEQEVKLKMIANLTSYIENVTALYDPPCQEMMIVASAERMMQPDPKNERVLTIQVNYLNEMFLEIANGVRFSAQGFLCRIGGFLGMFLGVSLLQIPDLVTKAIEGTVNKMKKLKTYQKDEKEPL